ncbi:thermonuclease family protein [Thalassobacillus pellis]|uniref:thermonuclease family protein n=1 Tax=Thalassobacillus pellis TaxID=748008 RepID=UPI00195F6E79|nr:thermonuclease family protein [Thalassobacillus pellis]MBM7553196.1 endonuclease YncB(thermonuclease family) [Thalassobacillus pellis]
MTTNVKIEELAKQGENAWGDRDVTINGYLAATPEEPLEDGYNYPLIDHNLNSMLVKSKNKLEGLEAGKWYDVEGRLDASKLQEMNVDSKAAVKESDKQPEAPKDIREFESTVKDVVDGDTIHLQKPVLGTTKIRLVSIDTPETNYQGDSQGYYAEEAKRQLQELLQQGEKVTVRVGEEPFDAYDRLLAIVWQEDTNMNKELILKGMAVPYFIYPNLYNFEEYGKAVVTAKEAGRGLWNPERPIDELPYEFRFNKRGGPDKYVGNHETKEYVEPEKWESVPIEERVFFFEESDAKKAGYSPQNEE